MCLQPGYSPARTEMTRGCVHRHPCQPGVTPGSQSLPPDPTASIFPGALELAKPAAPRLGPGRVDLPSRAELQLALRVPCCPEAHGRQAGSPCWRSQGWSCTLAIKMLGFRAARETSIC